MSSSPTGLPSSAGVDTDADPHDGRDREARAIGESGLLVRRRGQATGNRSTNPLNPIAASAIDAIGQSRTAPSVVR